MSAFEGCCELEEVSLSAGLSHVDLNAFKDCGSLTRILYPGSRDEWEICVSDYSDLIDRINF